MGYVGLGSSFAIVHVDTVVLSTNLPQLVRIVPLPRLVTISTFELSRSWKDILPQQVITTGARGDASPRTYISVYTAATRSDTTFAARRGGPENQSIDRPSTIAVFLKFHA